MVIGCLRFYGLESSDDDEKDDPYPVQEISVAQSPYSLVLTSFSELQKTDASYTTNGYKCYGCKQMFKGMGSWHCAKFKYNLCVDCYTKADGTDQTPHVIKGPEPPVVIVTDVSDTDATIRCQSKYDSALYLLRYRRDVGDDDDQKVAEWTERTLNDGVELTLSGLQSNCKYQICGMVVDNSVRSTNLVLSTTSEIVSFQTNQTLEWDTNRMGKNISLSNNNKTIAHKSGGYDTLLTKDIVSADSTVMVSLEIAFQSGHQYFGAGFVKASEVGQLNVNQGGPGRSRNPGWYLRLRASPGSKPTCTPEGNLSANWSEINAEWKSSNCSIGDRLLTVYDFTNSEITYSYNDTVIGVLSSLPKQIYIGVCPDSDGTWVTTKFERIPK